jgi:hypothetical protein
MPDLLQNIESHLSYQKTNFQGIHCYILFHARRSLLGRCALVSHTAIVKAKPSMTDRVIQMQDELW